MNNGIRNTDEDNLRLYSISGAAKALRISKDSLLNEINNGRISYINIRQRKKIPHSELLRYQKDSLVRKKPLASNKGIINPRFSKNSKSNLQSREIISKKIVESHLR